MGEAKHCKFGVLIDTESSSVCVIDYPPPPKGMCPGSRDLILLRAGFANAN